jgi:hypothetical protein
MYIILFEVMEWRKVEIFVLLVSYIMYVTYLHTLSHFTFHCYEMTVLLFGLHVTAPVGLKPTSDLYFIPPFLNILFP